MIDLTDMDLKLNAKLISYKKKNRQICVQNGRSLSVKSTSLRPGLDRFTGMRMNYTSTRFAPI